MSAVLSVAAVLFPVVAGSCALLALPVKLSRYFSPAELADRSALVSQPSSPFVISYYRFVTFVAIATGVASTVQFQLFRLASGGEQWSFAARLSDLFAASVGSGLLIAVATFWAPECVVARVRGRDAFRLLMMTELTGYPNVSSVSAFRTTILVVMLFCSALNCFVFDTFVRLNSERIEWSTFVSLATDSRKLTDLSCVVLYPSRVTPNGQVSNTPSVDLVFRSNEVVDTFYLLADATQHEHFVAALQEAAPRVGVPVERRETPHDPEHPSVCAPHPHQRENAPAAG